ncbi:SDR family NAD(P)-dependent oxidoreductase [Nocardia otitidiscaviarum]|uniref:SDR family NAD(P)-dependent oxidoreductase n=1 Tax=Nocardia otitidiscaviarum TaxID=1823 RepID=UPI0018952A74|nr:SDR family NAD(P)-dependent oxidoreductase [Nocardia otitidiscaviarum]MBF6237564.1 SDR family NAD(P)-dependent oxidoreductase [Nocardia otitidiscaviarum]
MPARPADRFDDLLDRTVALGYTRLGLRLRRRSWQPIPADALRGRTALVTGANSGIGQATATGLARLGARVTLLVRDVDRGRRAAAAIAATVPGSAPRVDECDVSNLLRVRAYAEARAAAAEPLDIVVHNAGVLPSSRTESPDGHELSLATHVLGPLLMTELLAPALARSDSARVILISSGGMYTQPLPVVDIEYRTGRYRGAAAYARSKRVQVALTPILAERYAAQGISVHAMHPGWVDTPGITAALPGFRRALRPLLRTAAEGADTAVWLATADVPSGLFWHDRRSRPTHYLRRTRELPGDRERVWRYCAAAAGIDPDSHPADRDQPVD